MVALSVGNDTLIGIAAVVVIVCGLVWLFRRRGRL
jgi:uncharacterized protein (TIGR03382 family)